MNKISFLLIASLVTIHCGDYASAQDKPLKKFRWGVTSLSASQWIPWIAKDAKLYEKYGLDAELVLLVECGGTFKLMSLAPGSGKRTVYDYRTIITPRDGGRLPGGWLRGIRVPAAVDGRRGQCRAGRTDVRRCPRAGTASDLRWDGHHHCRSLALGPRARVSARPDLGINADSRGY